MDSQTVLNNSTNSTTAATTPAPWRDLVVIAFLIVTAVVLAWPTLHMGVWLDECLSVNSSTAPDVVAVVKNAFGRQDDYHPPLAYMLLNVWMKMFGTGDVAVKVPFLLCGIATIPSLYWLGLPIVAILLVEIGKPGRTPVERSGAESLKQQDRPDC